MMTASVITSLLASRAFAHIYNTAPDALVPVVKIIGQTSGGFAIQKPDGSRAEVADASAAADHINAVLGLVRTKKERSRCYTFKPRSRGGLHVHFTTDATQVLVIWRYRDPDSNDIEMASGSYWAVCEEGCMYGSPDLSEQQRMWLESLRDEVDEWCDELTRRGLNANTGGKPNRPVGSYSIKINSSRRYRTIKA